MPERSTQRGFAMYADIETRDGSFTVQESSIATQHMVWVGLGGERGHLTVEQARIVRDALTEFIDGSTEPPTTARPWSTQSRGEEDSQGRPLGDIVSVSDDLIVARDVWPEDAALILKAVNRD